MVPVFGSGGGRGGGGFGAAAAAGADDEEEGEDAEADADEPPQQEFKPVCTLPEAPRVRGRVGPAPARAVAKPSHPPLTHAAARFGLACCR